MFRSSAQEGYFPKWFGKIIHNGTPLRGLILITVIQSLLAGLYTLYAIYNSGMSAVVWGSLVTFLGWTLYGFISNRFELGNRPVAPQSVG